MVATGVVCFFLGVTTVLAVQGFATWARVRGLPLGWWRWAACAAWALLVLAVVLFASVSWGEGEPRAALIGGAAGLALIALSTVALWRFVLRATAAHSG